MTSPELVLPLVLLALLAAQAAAVLLLSSPHPPHASGPPPAGKGRASPAESIFWELPLDIDRAGAHDLQRIPGIGLKRARRIVRWRREQGPIGDPGSLTAIPGIGEGTVELLRSAAKGRGSRSGEGHGSLDAMKY
jgi:competence ComEA-like helix-hairpin-helix protein